VNLLGDHQPYKGLHTQYQIPSKPFRTSTNGIFHPENFLIMTSVPILQSPDTGEKFESSTFDVEDTNKDGLHDAEASGFDLKATKRLVRKIDYVIIPFVALLYVDSSISSRCSLKAQQRLMRSATGIYSASLTVQISGMRVLLALKKTWA
jgi:hypothetical protein